MFDEIKGRKKTEKNRISSKMAGKFWKRAR